MTEANEPQLLSVIIAAFTFLFLISSAAIGWAWRLHGQLTDIKISVAVNSSKWQEVEKMESSIEEIKKSISEIKEWIAGNRSEKK